MIEYRKLDEICNIIMGQSPDSKSYNYEGLGLPFFQGNADFGDMYPTKRVWCTLPTKVVEPNTLLISVRAPIGALNFSNEPSCIGRGLAGIVPKESINLKYVYYCLRYKNTELNSKGTGSTFKAISKSALAEIKIKVVSKDRQAEIVTTLDDVTQIIKYRKQQLEQLDLLIKSRFVEMFGDVNTNENKWIVKKLNDICILKSGGTPSRQHPEYFEGTIPWITTVSLGKMVIDERDAIEFITEEAIENSATKLIPENSLLFGVRVGVGKVSKNIIPMCTNQDIVAITNIDEHTINLIFLKQNLDMFSNLFDNQKRGATIQGIKSDVLKNIEIILPPIELQNEFARFVEQVEKTKTQVQKSLDEAQLLFNSLMQEYFG